MENPLEKNCTTLQAGQRCIEDIIFNSVFDKIPSRPLPLISDDITHTLELAINVVGLYMTSLFGLTANIANILVYVRQGLKESITLGLFALSLSDLILVSMPLITASCHVAQFLVPESPIDFPSIHYVTSGWMRNMMYSMSCFITAFLSLERCCCIILPFKVKAIFTREKTALVVLVAFLFHLSCILMLPAAFELTWWPSRNISMETNMTRILRVVFFDQGEAIEVFNTAVMSLTVPAVTQVIVTICVVVMIHGLRVSAKFRDKATSRGVSTHIENEVYSTQVSNAYSTNAFSSDEKFTNLSTNNYETNSPNMTPATQKGKSHNYLSNRDARLIKTMVFLVCIQSACNVPFLAATFAWRSIPEMNIGMPYENTLRVVFSVVYLMGNLNASSNVFVYYHTSSSFRQVFNGILRCYPKPKKQPLSGK